MMTPLQRYLREYIRKQRDIFIGLSADFAGILAGFASSLLIPYLGRVEWILFVIPLLLTVRGAVNGAFSGRLTTGLNIGTIYPRLRKNTNEFTVLVATMLLVGVLNSIIATFIIGLYLGDITKFFVGLIVLVDLFFIASCLSVLLTSIIGFLAFQHNVDPDAVVYPIMSTINDILGSLLLLLMIVLLEPWNPMNAFIRGTPLLIAIIFVLATQLRKAHRNPTFRRTLAEIYPAIIFSLALSSISGYILTQLETKIVAHPGILIVLPAMMDTIGDLGAIFASFTTTKLHLGTIELRLRSLLSTFPQLPDYLIPLTILACTYTFFGAILSGTLGDLIFLLSTYIAIGLMGTLMILPLSLGIAVATFRYGLNPDNLSIPILTATADLLTIGLVYLIV